MEIALFSQCIKDLILENDRVDVPYLGTFSAEMMPATYSDRQTTIHPPYRKMSFHKDAVALADGRLLLDKVVQETGVSLDQAGVELGWCLSRLSSELEGRKICRLPGLGVMRANARNEFYFVPDDDLDIWPDGIGFESIPIKISEKMPDQVGHDAEAGVRGPEEDFAVSISEPKRADETQNRPGEARVKEATPVKTVKVRHHRRRMEPWKIALIAAGALLVLFIAASYLFTDFMSPVLDRLLYTREELELLQGR